MVAKLSSIGFAVVNGCSSWTAMGFSFVNSLPACRTTHWGRRTGFWRCGPSRTGAIAKAGHDLLMHVTEWSATLDTGEAPSLTLDADGTSLRVREGTGGIKPLDEDDLDEHRDDDRRRGPAQARHRVPLDLGRSATATRSLSPAT